MEFEKIAENVQEQMRSGMRYWASGVGVVTAAHNGAQMGMTVSSFTSVSLAPPIVLVSLHKDTRTHGLVLDSGAFAVTMLAQSQEEISARFAGQLGDNQDRFAGLDTFTLETGSPLLSGGISFFDCKLVGSYDAHTATVMFGEVLAARVAKDPREIAPLVYQNRGYREIKLD